MRYVLGGFRETILLFQTRTNRTITNPHNPRRSAILGQKRSSFGKSRVHPTGRRVRFQEEARYFFSGPRAIG